MALSYFINRKKAICVITLKGSLSIDDVEPLEACLKEVMLQPASYVVVNFAGVEQVDVSASRPLTLFQQGLRAKAKLFLCEILPEIGKHFSHLGLVREAETFPNLVACLQEIIVIEKKQGSK